MPSLSKPNINLNLSLRRRDGLVGLDIQPGYVAAVQAHVNGGIAVQRAAGAPLAPDAIREGEVLDERLLGETLRELFHSAPLGKRVRVGLANQRTVLRTLELPPVSDRKQLAAAVRFQAEDQVPMPLANAVLDFHSLGTFDTPDGGRRQRVIVVAAQREMVERLLRAVRHAGLRPEGVDLSAFALIRSLYRPVAGADGQVPTRVLYLNVGGLTNMAIAEGPVCRFTRVVGGGLEAMASEIAERRGIPLTEARTLLATFELKSAAASPAPVVFHAPTPVPAAAEAPAVPIAEASDAAAVAPASDESGQDQSSADDEPDIAFHEGFGTPPEPPAVETWALAQDPHGVAQDEGEPALDNEPAPDAQSPAPVAQSPAPDAEPPALAAQPAVSTAMPAPAAPDPEIRMVLENGIREIAGEVRNSLDFHRSQDGGGEVLSVVLSGPALEIVGFAEALEADLGIAVERQAVSAAGPEAFAHVSEHHLAIATGLATEEAVR
ncbi:MAG TPA: pilus assembly protein PilM [Solirubrobacteraceae bacterium]|nr:pilus assembly protein PilM [Solirubrobacteraceae bacterium]